jgi:hypothetical protein
MKVSPPDREQFGNGMMTVVAIGVMTLSSLSVLCFAAYKIKARSFEVSTSIGRVASFSIKIMSADVADAHRSEPAGDSPVLLGSDARPTTNDEVSLL